MATLCIWIVWLFHKIDRVLNFLFGWIRKFFKKKDNATAPVATTAVSASYAITSSWATTNMSGVFLGPSSGLAPPAAEPYQSSNITVHILKE